MQPIEQRIKINSQTTSLKPLSKKMGYATQDLHHQKRLFLLLTLLLKNPVRNTKFLIFHLSRSLPRIILKIINRMNNQILTSNHKLKVINLIQREC